MGYNIVNYGLDRGKLSRDLLDPAWLNRKEESEVGVYKTLAQINLIFLFQVHYLTTLNHDPYPKSLFAGSLLVLVFPVRNCTK